MSFKLYEPLCQLKTQKLTFLITQPPTSFTDEMLSSQDGNTQFEDGVLGMENLPKA